MLESTTTRGNPLVDPALHVWAWPIPVYLFLGGLVAGMMMICGWFLFADRHRRAESVLGVLPGLSIVSLSLGMLALFLDLEHKASVWRLYTTFMPRSPMSWGAWILIAVYPALLATVLLRPPAALARAIPALGRWSDALLARPRLTRAIAATDMTLGALLGIYTGVLLSTLAARPLWNSALLGPLFLASGLSSAAALVHLIARDRDERVLLARADNRFLLAELALIALLLVGLVTTSRAHAEAAALLLGGPFTAPFWVGVVGVGIVVPLFIQTLAVGHRVRHTAVAPLMVLTGGLVLRFVIVVAGQSSHVHPY